MVFDLSVAEPFLNDTHMKTEGFPVLNESVCKTFAFTYRAIGSELQTILCEREPFH